MKSKYIFSPKVQDDEGLLRWIYIQKEEEDDEEIPSTKCKWENDYIKREPLCKIKINKAQDDTVINKQISPFDVPIDTR